MSDSPLPVDRNGLEVLSRRECLELLGTTAVGRIAVVSDALPAIEPVPYRMDGEKIIVRTSGAAARNGVVAFETDVIRPGMTGSWSVLVTGTTEDLAESASGAHEVAISTQLMTGRRLTA